MGYNPEAFARIIEEYEVRTNEARAAARARMIELENIIPGLADLDAELSTTGMQIMDAIKNHPDKIQEKLAEIEARNELLLQKKHALIVAAGYPSDYTDVHYLCEDCSDTGYRDGKMCHCLKTALALESYEHSGIANLLRTQTFESFSLDYYRQNPRAYEQMSKNLTNIRRFAEQFHGKNSGHLAFFGNTGLGKTHLSSAVAKTVIDRGYDVMYTTAIAMISDFEYQRFGSSSNTEVSPTSRYFDCDLLIIDDLGTEISNQFTVTTLYNVIDTRIKTGRSMLISTNLSPDELRKRYWDRITSRLFGEFSLVSFVGVDVRAQKTQKNS